jgi:hypothetical protein
MKKSPGRQHLIVEQDRIDAYEATGRRFMSEILEMDWDSILVTDLSALSDFSSCGLPDDIETGDTLESLYNAWDAWVIPKIEEVFGIRLEKTTILLVDLFDTIEKKPALSIRH